MIQLRNASLVHFCSSRSVIDEKSVRIVATKKFSKNISSFGRAASYFFVGEPSWKQMAVNEIKSYEYKVEIPFAALEKEKVRFRPVDGVVVYLGSYEGSAKITLAPIDKRAIWGIYALRKIFGNLHAGGLIIWSMINVLFVSLLVTRGNGVVSLEITITSFFVFFIVLMVGSVIDWIKRFIKERRL